MSLTTFRRRALAAALVVGATAGSAAFSVPASAQDQPSREEVVAVGLGLDPIGDAAAVALERLEEYGVRSARYIDQRDEVADAVADRLGLDPALMQYAWAKSDASHQRAVLGGLTQLGVPYRTNTSSEGRGFDCSGLTTFAWSHAGISLTRQSAAQIAAAAPRTFETVQAGDLVYYPGHVSMWLGVDKAILHAPSTGRTVEIRIQTGNKALRLGNPVG